MIHPTAIVSKKAKIAEGVEIGPYTIVEENVEIKEGTVIGPFCTITGHTIIGKNNQIFSGAVIGSVPQDLKYRGERSWIIIGDNNKIREYVTINPGTGEEGKTVIGDNNLLMAYAHIAHDCIIGNGTIIANLGTLAGHVVVEDSSIVGGLAAIHQFVRIGKFAIVGGCSKVVQDIPPYSTCDGHPARVRGLNTVGLRRGGFSAQKRAFLKRAFKILFFSGHPLTQGIQLLEQIAEVRDDEDVKYLLSFLRNSCRGICL